MTVSPGTVLDYQWSSSGGTSYVWSGHDENGNSIPVCDSANPGNSYCDTASGSTDYTATSAMAGHTYTVNFTASNNDTSQCSSVGTVTVTVPWRR